ncbi:MAG: hypothetical protein K8R46_14115 [Pirellulales bacterium]|nr:hypothetical protein [Pirellulales bacterium]
MQEVLGWLQASVHTVDAGLQQDGLADCMERLPESDRQLVKVCHGSHEGFRQVAERLGRSPQSVYDSLSRIRRVLFECIDRAVAREERSRNAEERR